MKYKLLFGLNKFVTVSNRVEGSKYLFEFDDFLPIKFTLKDARCEIRNHKYFTRNISAVYKIIPIL